MDEVHITSPASTAHVPPPGIQPVSPSKPKEEPKILYPSRLNKTKLLDKNDVQVSKFLKILKQFHFDISLIDALTQIPKYHKVLKDLLKDKEKLEELANTSINVECSAIFLNKFPEKLEDPGKFLIPCILQDLEGYNSLADFGASINLMPLSIYEKLGIGPLKPTRMTLELANRSVTYSMGIAEDVIVKVEKFNFLADFIIVDFEADPRVPIILGRPFLRTEKALMDLDIQSFHCINVIDFSKDKPISGSTTSPSDFFPSSSLDETSDYSLEKFADTFPSGNEDDNFDYEADLREIEYLLNRDASIDFLPKTDIDITNPILENKIKDSKRKILIDELESPESNALLPQLLECDSTLHEELLEINTLPSFPFRNEDKVFNLGILVHGSTHVVTNEVTQDKNLKEKTSSEALLILMENNFLSHSSYRSSYHELLFFLELTVIETLLSFSSENEDKVFNPGILIFNRVHSINLDLSHRSGTFICINVYLNILNENPMENFLSTYFSPNITMIWGESS
ncbi:reverse transcriptase domain-containing protein [Tanacetum coccineum]